MVIAMDLADQGKTMLSTSAEACLLYWDELIARNPEFKIFVHGREFKTHFESNVQIENELWEKTFSNEAIRHHVGAILSRDLEFWERPYYWFIASVPQFDLLFMGSGLETLIYRVIPQNERPLRAYAKKSKAYINWREDVFMLLLNENPKLALKIAQNAWLKDREPQLASNDTIMKVENECRKLISNVVQIR